LTNLEHTVGRGTIANVLKRNGIEPITGAQPTDILVHLPQGTLEGAGGQ